MYPTVCETNQPYYCHETSSSTTHGKGSSSKASEQLYSVSEIIGSIRSEGGSVSQLDRVAAAAASTEGDSPAITGRGLILGISNKTGNNKGPRNSKKKPPPPEQKKPNGLPSTVHGEGMEACIIPGPAGRGPRAAAPTMAQCVERIGPFMQRGTNGDDTYYTIIATIILITILTIMSLPNDGGKGQWLFAFFLSMYGDHALVRYLSCREGRVQRFGESWI